MYIFWFILIGVIGGWMTTVLAKGGTPRLFEDSLFGVIGSLAGGFIFPTLGYTVNTGFMGNTAPAIAGAIISILSFKYIREWINSSKVRRLKISQKHEEIK
ncbi:MAG: GlsB/YeaQ/YmgE family stress response membrane protein [Candidatus Riflebacteria bacterium]|nr:GlsB/YeaQ/YmgE family stress response membrane protein [Candidatus Riflebacteria bacterium]